MTTNHQGGSRRTGDTVRQTDRLLLLRWSDHTYAIRFDAAHPLAAYFLLEDWLRAGILPQAVFGYAICQVCQAANEAKEGAK